MTFVSTNVLWWALLFVPVIAWFLAWSWRKRQALVRQFVSERLLEQLLEGVSPQRQKIQIALLVAAVLFLFVALARPQWGFVWEEATQRSRDILIAIDTSRSMLAEDMAPNRLTRAKLAALDLLRLAKNDRLGLIAFAGGSFLQSPLTLDDEAFRQNVNALDTSIIPQGGTAITEAINTALSAFATEEDQNHRVLVIFSDGEDQETGAIEAAERAAEKGLRIFTVGVGTPAGELIKVTDANGQPTFIKDSAGNVVKSRLNEDLLRQIATKGNGFYLALREGNAMQALFQRGLEPLPTSEVSSKLVRHLNEQFHWPLGIAIALLVTEILLPSAPKRRAKTAAATALLFLLLIPQAQASPGSAYRSYQSGNYKDARSEYDRLLQKNPDDPQLNYNAGAAAYRAGAFDAAAKQFSNAVRAQDLNLQQSAYYNLGNSNFRLGADESDPQKKMALWQQAVQNFESSIKLNPKDADATFNRDLVKKKLEELQKQQQKQDQKKDENKDENKDEKKDQQKKEQEQQQNKDNKDEKQEGQKKEDNEEEQPKPDQQKQDEQKKEQEQKDQQSQAQNDQQGQQDKEGEPKESGEQQDPKQQAEQEARAAALGQMTPRQAQQLLDAQKSEEKALIYRPPQDSKKARERMLKDW